MTQSPLSPRIIDYEGSSYKTDFWLNQGREYEDLCERLALKALLPPTGDILMEAGAGFGRLASLYSGYGTVILLDHSLSMLKDARGTWGADKRFLFVAANIYHLPFAENVLDTVVMIRVMHHLESPALALAEISRSLRGNGTFILEYANKRNLKAILRFGLRRQHWNPFDEQPYEFAPLNFDFHPDWMASTLQAAGFAIEEERAISSFRLSFLKRRIPASWLAHTDFVLSRPGGQLKLSPSVVVRARNTGTPRRTTGALFRCPACRTDTLRETGGGYLCAHCARRWPEIDGILDFRWPKGS